MKSRPWLEPDDEQWLQQLRWNLGREILFSTWYDLKAAHAFARNCPLIEEARWFRANVPNNPALSRGEMTERILANGRSPRNLAYAGILGQDDELLRDAALNGDPIAQLKVAFLSNYPAERQQGYLLSMLGGYSEAFASYANMLYNQDDFAGEKVYLEKGIAAASPGAIQNYSDLDRVDKHRVLYFVGRVWQIVPRNDCTFTKLALSWYTSGYNSKVKREKDFTTAFIIGRLCQQLSPHAIKDLDSANRDPMVLHALRVAHRVYTAMLDKTRHEIYTWMLVGKVLGVSKDIRKVIALQVWRYRERQLVAL